MSALPAPTRPAEQMRQLDYLLGIFDCEGRALAMPPGTARPVKRTLATTLDLGGHWLFMRIDEAPTPDRPDAVCGNWQITYDRRRHCFLSLWTDSLGRWAEQTSDGWKEDTLEFVGAVPVNDKPGAVRDTLVRRSADEMLFLVEFQVDGTWTRALETTCRRRATAR